MKKRNEDNQNIREDNSEGLSAEELKELNYLLERLHQADYKGLGSIVFNIYKPGSCHVDTQINIGIPLCSSPKGEKKQLDKELLSRAIENSQAYFWANSAYAVVFCICRDIYKMGTNKTAFEEMVEGLPYKNNRDHTCSTGTIANAFSDNPIFNEHVMDWEKFDAAKRIIKLRDKLFRELKL